MRVAFEWDHDDVENPGNSYSFKEDKLVLALSHPGVIWINSETDEEFQQLVALFNSFLASNKLPPLPLRKWAFYVLQEIATGKPKPLKACRKYLTEGINKKRGRPTKLERKHAIQAQVKELVEQQKFDVSKAADIVADKIGLAGSTVRGIYYEDLPSLEADQPELIFEDDHFPDVYIAVDWFPADWLKK